MSQPNLSRNIKNLENELGYPLFDRTKKRLILNKNGAAARECVQRIFHEIDKLHALHMRNDDRIPLHFIGNGAVYYDILIPLLQKELPWYEIHCHVYTDPDELQYCLINNENILLFGDPFLFERIHISETFESLFLMTDQLCVSIPDKYSVSCRKSIQAKELGKVLKDLPVIISTHPESAHSRQLLKDNNIKLNISYFTNQTLNSRQLTNSDGIIFDTMLVSYFPLSSTRRFVPLEGENTKYDVLLFYRKSEQSYTNDALEWLRDFFQDFQM